MKYLLNTIVLLLSFSCATHKEIGKISLSVDKATKKENYFELMIEAIDNDGIEQVSLEIPSLNISETFFPDNKKKWLYQRELFIENKNNTSNYVQVSLIDKNGKERVKRLKLIH